MQERHARRRLAALNAAGRRSLTDPLFNLREITKQMVLLEDHLTHGYKQCPDCIRKHLLTIEAFAEEAAALDPTGPYSAGAALLAETARTWMESFHDKTPPESIADAVRTVRKTLVPLCCDPRVMNRVASRTLSRQ